jgi:hypothetical protein
MPVIWVRRKAEYFFKPDWTAKISLIPLENFVFWRKWKKADVRVVSAAKARV